MATVNIKKTTAGVIFSKDAVRVGFDADVSMTSCVSGNLVVFVVDGVRYFFSTASDIVTINDVLFSGTALQADDKLRDEVFISAVSLPTDGLLANFDYSDPATMTFAGTPTTVVTATDKSASARVMAMTSGSTNPLYNATGGVNNLPWIRVQAGTEFGTTAVQAQPFTVYMIMRTPAFVDGKRYLMLDNGGTVWVGTEYGTTSYAAGASGPIRRGGDLYKADRWQLLAFTFDNDNFKSNARINNEPNALHTYQEGGPGANGMQIISFGPYYRSTQVDYHHLLVYAGDMTTTKDKAIRTWLLNRYPVLKNNYLAAFGDSITTGAAATNIITEAWVTLVAAEKSMNQYNYGVSGSVAVPTTFHPGISGQNFVDTILALEDDPDYPTGTFVISYGTNDQSPDAAYKATFKSTIQTKLINRGIALNKIIITTAPSLKTANAYIRQIASELSITLFDAEAYIAANGGSSLFDADGIHLNTAGHRKFADGLKLVMV